MNRCLSLLLLLLLMVCRMPVANADGAAEQVTPAPVDPVEATVKSLRKQLRNSTAESSRQKDDLKNLQRLAAQAPDLVQQMHASLDAVSRSGVTEKLDTLDLEGLTRRLTSLEIQQQAIDAALGDVYEQMAKQQNVPNVTRSMLADIQSALDDAEAASSSGDNQDSPDVVAAREELAQAEKDRLYSAKKLYESQLASYQKLLELYTANRDLLSVHQTNTKELYRQGRARFDLLSKDESARQQAAFNEIESQLAGFPKPVISAAVNNRKHNDQLVLLQESLRQVTAWDKDVNNLVLEVRQRYQIAQQQLDIGGYNQLYMEHIRYVARNLRPQLSAYGDAEGLRNALLDARSKQFGYDDDLRQLRGYAERQKKIEQLLTKLTPEEAANPSVIPELQKIYSKRAEILTMLSEVNGKYVVALTTFDISRDKLLREEQRFTKMINQKLVWLHSSPAMGPDSLIKLPKGAYYFFANSPWGEIPQYVDEYRIRHSMRLIAYVLFFSVLLYLRPRLLKRLDAMSTMVGRVMKDKFRYTLEALMITAAASLAPAVVVAGFADALSIGSPYQSFAYSLGDVLRGMVPIVFMLSLLPVMMRDNGLATLHFRWSDAALKSIRRHVPLVIAQLPLYFTGMYIAQNAGDIASVFVFGRVLLLAANLMLVWIFWSILKPGGGLVERVQQMSFFDVEWRKRFLWTPIIITVPAACSFLVVMGYDFTVVSIARAFYVTLLAGFGIFILHQVVMRWFAVQERQIALDRAVAKRSASQAAKSKDTDVAASEAGVDFEEIDGVNLETINEQNRALLKVVASVSFAAAAWQLWSDMAPALDVLDHYVLWSVKAVGEAGQAVEVNITLWRMITACFVMVITLISARNLPGLVELVLLQRFQLDKSIRFAITTVARYCIFAVGIMLVSEQLSIEWEKIGWLVAALGLGLGFGLQEIFANFISGIIILIERPIRIGDLVTIGDKSGVVSHIRMRATTIMDADQRELLIPNKVIMTNQLVNWTLSDAVTRVVFPVTLVPGVDTSLVISTLLDIARNHPNVMKAPAPGAYFLGFGDTGLKFELRVFVPEFTKRGITSHEINMEIDRRFREQGIALAAQK